MKNRLLTILTAALTIILLTLSLVSCEKEIEPVPDNSDVPAVEIEEYTASADGVYSMAALRAPPVC